MPAAMSAGSRLFSGNVQLAGPAVNGVLCDPQLGQVLLSVRQAGKELLNQLTRGRLVN